MTKLHRSLLLFYRRSRNDVAKSPAIWVRFFFFWHHHWKLKTSSFFNHIIRRKHPFIKFNNTQTLYYLQMTLNTRRLSTRKTAPNLKPKETPKNLSLNSVSSSPSSPSAFLNTMAENDSTWGCLMLIMDGLTTMLILESRWRGSLGLERRRMRERVLNNRRRTSKERRSKH